MKTKSTLEQSLRKLDFWNWVSVAACILGIIVLLVFNHYCPNVK